MSVISEIVGRVLKVRAMLPSDLPRLLQIENAGAGTRFLRKDLPANLFSTDRGIWVATIQNHVVGYLVYQLTPETEASESELQVGPPKGPWGRRVTSLPPLQVELIHLFVSPDWRRRGIGRALITRFDPRLSKDEPCVIQAMVPETNLPVQLLLRSAGYKAARVSRRYFVEEDAYVMECRHGELTPARVE
jgi:ribosomal protein S18 acetylase RimI-like enzyme